MNVYRFMKHTHIITHIYIYTHTICHSVYIIMFCVIIAFFTQEACFTAPVLDRAAAIQNTRRAANLSSSGLLLGIPECKSLMFIQDGPLLVSY